MKNVAAYCRVSTDDDDQKNSFESQKSYFENYINQNLEWKLAGIYADEGISGTSTKKRKEFNRMIDDAETGKIDIIVTKEISRFARNTVDALQYTRKLREWGVSVIFINDNLDTLTQDSELWLTIRASMAQEESRKTSERVKWGQQRQMEKGVVFGNSVFGYDILEGVLYVNEQQAEIVRMIFRLYLEEGMGTHILCHELENRGILSPSGDTKWKNASILRILKNEKYIGTLKQKKEITLDFLTHKKVINNGVEDFVIIENHHEPIITREMFEAVQREITRRRTTALDKSKHSNRYIWSGKIECAYCHAKFKRKIWNGKSDHPSVVWQCGENIRNGAEKLNGQGVQIGCSSKAIHEEILRQGVQIALHEVTKHKDKIIREIKQDVKAVLLGKQSNQPSIEALCKKIEALEQKKTRLIELYTDGTLTRAEFDKSNEQYSLQAEAYRKELNMLTQEENRTNELRERLTQIDETIEKIAGFEEFSDEICKQVLSKIVAFGRDKFAVYFVGGSDDAPFFIPLSITPWVLR